MRFLTIPSYKCTIHSVVLGYIYLTPMQMFLFDEFAFYTCTMANPGIICHCTFFHFVRLYAPYLFLLFLFFRVFRVFRVLCVFRPFRPFIDVIRFFRIVSYTRLASSVTLFFFAGSIFTMIRGL